MLLYRHGAAVRLVNGDTAHRCWQTVAANMLFRRLRIRGSALRRGWIDKSPIRHGSEVSVPTKLSAATQPGDKCGSRNGPLDPTFT